LTACELSPEACEPLKAYAWPGNVRQLRNVLEQAVIEARGPQLHPRDLAALLQVEGGEDSVGYGEADIERTPEGLAADEAEPEASNANRVGWTTLAEMERAHIVRTLDLTFFNRAAAARLLGISRQALLRKMDRYGIAGPGL
jgi:DNA-binding NtrC family response regulator